ALRQEAPNVVFVVQHADYWRIPDLLAMRPGLTPLIFQELTRHERATRLDSVQKNHPPHPQSPINPPSSKLAQPLHYSSHHT
ncbi:hypothetical protein, partial [Pseudomonas sp. SWRI99]|uniref:hypothetical protein n=1 Tax=Pseudomonas sp. SWRI99 TaxID=2745506 RepID=UPI001EE21B1B